MRVGAEPRPSLPFPSLHTCLWMLPTHKPVMKMFYSKHLGKEIHKENHFRGVLEKNQILSSHTSLTIIPIYIKRDEDLSSTKQPPNNKNKATSHFRTLVHRNNMWRTHFSHQIANACFWNLKPYSVALFALCSLEKINHIGPAFEDELSSTWFARYCTEHMFSATVGRWYWFFIENN